MSEHGVITERGTIVFQRTLPGPIERVWAYLTESEKRGKWLAAGEMELKVGGKVELKFFHADLSPIHEAIPEKYKDMKSGARFTGRVTRYEPPRVLAYTWAESWGDDSEVTFELSEQGEEVHLLLTHRRLGDRRETLISVAGGWHTHLGILADVLAGRTPQPFWSTHSALEAEYGKRINP
jgi:uncharacterized protein YndB with AHSA1/START domain